MAKFIIHGGKPLKGTIPVYGAKNAAIKMIAASCLFDKIITLDNVPDILDIQKIIQILQIMGVKFKRLKHRLIIDPRKLQPKDPDPELVKTIRASIVLVGPLLARFGKVSIPHPGGCVIGSRPIDLHIKAFRDLGVKVREVKDGYVFILQKKILDQIHFKKISVTATENILLFASVISKAINISNVAIEPEVKDLIEFLKKAGVRFKVAGRKIQVKGTSKLKRIKYRVMPDRIEAGTFAILAATAQSDLKITQLNTGHLGNLLDKFKKMNILFEKGNDFLYIKKPNVIKPIKISTGEYPGFPTDLQSPMGVLMTQAQGKSEIIENIWEHRLGYLEELKSMGANVKLLSPRQAEIYGPTPLFSAKIPSLDLRSGATMLIAGLIAHGATEIDQAENIDRGYERIEERLQKIGADIKRIE